MLTVAHYRLDDIQLFIKQALQWASLFNSACCFHSQGHINDPYHAIDVLIAAGADTELKIDDEGQAFAQIQRFLTDHPQHFIPGFLTYDLKNEIEDLETKHPNEQGIPVAYFFIPQHVIQINDNQVTIQSNDPSKAYQEIISSDISTTLVNFQGTLKAKMTKEAYDIAFHHLHAHIHRGDIYEINLCQEFFAEQAQLNPLAAYWQLSAISPTPFSCYFKAHENYILSASPERFLAKRRQTLISQPIKGTAPRGKTPEEDALYRRQLLEDQKEISENVMIVDLVRNDLTRCAQPRSVRVKELMGLYSFQQVHQLISTIIAQEKDGMAPIDTIKALFPAGSMTGAPKISAMKLADQYEFSRRGLYAGSMGYFAENGDYDFNVVIRTLLYNTHKKRLSFHVGGAITATAEAEKEYAECLLKAQAIMQLLSCKV